MLFLELNNYSQQALVYYIIVAQIFYYQPKTGSELTQT